MKYRNKTSLMIISPLLILLFGYIAYIDNRVMYKVFLLAGIVSLSVIYIFAIFEYYMVEESKLIHVNRLGFQKKEVSWNEINSMYIFPKGYFKAVRISYGMLNEEEIVINAGVKNYKELDKTKGNPKIVIDKKILELLN